MLKSAELRSLSEYEKRLKVSLSAQELEDFYQKRLLEHSKTIRLKGFRLGKVPVSEVAKRFGKKIREELYNQLMQQTYLEHLQTTNLRVISAPQMRILSSAEGVDFEYEAVFEVHPEFELADFKGIKLNKPKVAINEADVEALVLTLREQQSVYNKVVRPAQLEDQVTIDFIGSVNGAGFEGGSFKGGDLILGSGVMIPGFEEAIVGLQAGDTKSINLVFPSDHEPQSLANQPVNFDITLHEVREAQLPELDEHFIQSFGVDLDLKSFKQEVRSNMELELELKIFTHLKTQVINELLARNTFPIPEKLLEREIKRLRADIESKASNSEPDFSEDYYRTESENRIRMGLIVNQIVSDKKLSADKKQVTERIEKIANQYEDKEDIINWYNTQPLEYRNIETLVLEDSVIELIMAEANISDFSQSYSEFMKSGS